MTDVSEQSVAAGCVERIPVAEFHARLDAQGVGKLEVALVCPICGTVQSAASLIAAGASPDEAKTKIGFSCEGRLTKAGPWPRKPTKARMAVRGCDWSLGGLFQLHRLEVDVDGVAHPCFEVATPEQAQALAALLAAPRAGEGVNRG